MAQEIYIIDDTDYLKNKLEKIFQNESLPNFQYISFHRMRDKWFLVPKKGMAESVESWMLQAGAELWIEL